MARFYTEKDELKKPKIDNGNIVNFFNIRAGKIEELDPLRVVMYQDGNPKLVIQRDIAEKEILLPKLKLDNNTRILDVGCGTGRWVDSLGDSFKHYHGIDIGSGFINYARNKFKNNNIKFSVNKIENLSLEVLEEDEKFNLLLCMGVLIYLNDDDLIRALKSINEMMSANSRLVFREPIAMFERLTLIDEYSEEMQQKYSAIYRTQAELLSFFILYLNKFNIMECDVLFDDSLNNRKDTQQHYFILDCNCEAIYD